MKRFVVCAANNVNYDIHVSKAYNTEEEALAALRELYNEVMGDVSDTLDACSFDGKMYKVSCYNNDLFYGLVTEIEVEPEREIVLDGSYRNGPGDIKVSGMSDYELCFVGDHEKMVDFAELTKEEFLYSYSFLTEEEYDATQRVVDEYFPRAVKDFEELRVKVKGLPEHVELREACDLLGGHNFTEKEFFDLNYGCLCVTVHDVANAGVYLAPDGIELWNDNGEQLGAGLSYDFMAKVVNSLENVIAKATHEAQLREGQASSTKGLTEQQLSEVKS